MRPRVEDTVCILGQNLNHSIDASGTPLSSNILPTEYIKVS